MKIKKTLLCTSIICGTSIFAQTWQTGGNNFTTPQSVTTANNFLGTGNANQANNTPLKIGVNFSQDILIDNNPAQLYPVDPNGLSQGGHWIGLGRIFRSSTGPGSFPLLAPKAHLHIHGGNNTPNWGFAGGLRSWMNTGTLYTENSDGMYVGLKNISPNFSYAVINWSDDAFGGTGGSDFLSFNFTGGPTPFGNMVDGQEVGRFSPTQGKGTLGIGNFQQYGASTEPTRRLEILDVDPATGTNANMPQLRTTYTYNTTPTLGVFTEFQTTKLGDMYFNTRSNGNARRFGFHANSPGNTVEITSQIGVPYYNSTNGSSGLRLTNMKSNAIPVTNPGQGVLSVDANGDVIYVPKGEGGFGAECGSPNPYNLSTNWRVGLNNKRLNFDDAAMGCINIGFLQTNGCFNNQLPVAKVFIRNTLNGMPETALHVAGRGPFAAASNIYSAYMDAGDVYIGGDGFFSNGTQIISDKNVKEDIAVIKNPFEIINKLRPSSYVMTNKNIPQLAVDGDVHYGFIAQEIEEVLPSLVKVCSVKSRLDSTGVEIDSVKQVKSVNYNSIVPFAIAGLQELNAKQREIQATLNKAGLSDLQVKTNVNTFNALSKIKTLNPVKYNFTNQNVPQLSFSNNLDYGFVAQQLETVYPELIDTLRVEATYDSLGTIINPSVVLKTVNYKAMTALLVRSIQEQQMVIDSLKTAQSKQDSINQAVQQQLAALLTQINACCSNTTVRKTNSDINQLDIELSDKDAVVLNQNVPNPFAEQTTITYNVPTHVGKAQLLFYNAEGKLIQTVDITTRGKGKVNVFANDLSSGLYHYTLVVDGKVADSKKMIRE